MTLEPLPVEIEAPGLEGVVLQLAPAGRLTGALLGLSEAERARVDIHAGAERRGTRRVVVLSDGSYRIDGLAPGEWRVWASVDGRSVARSVTIEPLVEETTLDLEFDGGYTISGFVLSYASPAAGASVHAVGSRGGSSVTDSDGHFQIRDLSEGSYRLEAWNAEGTARAIEDVELNGDETVTLELAEGRLVGRVVASDTGAPVARASVSVTPLELGRRSASWTEADDNGDFRVYGQSGDVQVVVIAEGYARGERLLEIGTDSEERVLFELDPGEPLRLSVRSLGRALQSVNVTLLDGDGRAIARDSGRVGAGGAVAIHGLPEGRHRVIVWEPGFAARRVRRRSGRAVTDRHPLPRSAARGDRARPRGRRRGDAAAGVERRDPLRVDRHAGRPGTDDDRRPAHRSLAAGR